MIAAGDPGVGHVGLCFSRGETSFCNDMPASLSITNEASARPEDDTYYKSVIAEPIKIDNTVIGVFVITSNLSSQFNENIHVQCVRVIAQLLGLSWKISTGR